jgi:CheY-specific phosphatase CheX
MIALDREVLLDAVTTAVNQAMEAMFFDAAEPVAECDCCAGSEIITVCLWFHDAMDGEFLLATPLPGAMALAASFMGLDNDEVERTNAEQTLCELANIICGSALSRLEPSSELRLSPPMMTPRRCDGENGAMYQHYRLLDGCLAVSLRIDAL